jgi:hypothetical protein
MTTWISTGVATVVLALALVPGCSKGEGKTCFKKEDCAEGLACMGAALMRCEKCDTHDGCGADGLCTAKEGACVAASDDECKKAYICTNNGACTAKDGKCTVGGDGDCKQSQACAKQGFCKAKGNNCIKEKTEEKKEEKKE